MVGDNLIVYNPTSGLFSVEAVESLDAIASVGAFDPQIIQDGQRTGARIIVDGVFASHHTGVACSGPDIVQTICMYSCVQYWNITPASLGYGVLLKDLPVVQNWGDYYHHPWVRTLQSNSDALVNVDYMGFVNSVNTLLDNGTVFTDESLLALMLQAGTSKAFSQ